MNDRVVSVGDELPSYERMSSFQHWNRYAAVNYEFVDIHMDDRAGKRAGYPGAFGMGNLQWAYLHCLLRTWLNGSGRIVRLQCQFRAPNLNDLRTIARGRVTAVREEDNERLIELDVWTETEEGTVMAPGSATVALPS
jgi:acyl dehydratase